MSFPALLRRNAAEQAGKAAIVTADATITYVELAKASHATASRLVAAGVGKGARVGVLLPNGIEWAVTAAATWQVGGVVVPLSTLLRRPELEAQGNLAALTHLVYANEFRGRYYGEDVAAVTVPSLRVAWAVDELPTNAAADELVDSLANAVRPADDFVILFTSGSRGTPKGTVHTHGSALRAVASGLDARCIGPDDRLYIPMPFFWTGGLASGLLSAFVAGATLITEAVPEPEQTLALLERERVTLFRGWPDQAARLAAHPRFEDADLSCLGGGSLPAVLPAAARPAPGTRANVFGMTETFGPYCGARLDQDLPEKARGSCGRPFDGFDVRVVDDEIEIRGPNVMRAIRGRTRDETFGPDGYYRTGDLGTLDADGFLRYRGRRDDMFKVSGATVYPAEVEAGLRAIDGVRQAHVTDVQGSVGALVVTSVPLAELAVAAKERLSAFKLPTCWVVTDSADAVPMTATAKVDKTALQTLLEREGTRQ
jgi:acyl-CoA synthetase (AMP-forming)/AMP-acid ligase II